MSAKRRFRQGLVATLAAAAGIAITLAAGVWQLGRADEKARRQEQLDALRREPPITLPSAAVPAADLLYRRVRVVGAFAPEHTVYLDNRLRHGVPGFEIVTPMRSGESGRFVAVNRGWIAGGARRETLPEVRTPAGTVTVEGTVVPAQRVYQLDHAEAAGKVWLSFSVDRLRKDSRLDLEPLLIQQESELDDGLAREWEHPDTGRDKHLAYAFQWFAMAFAILAAYVGLGFRRGAADGQA
ncbi:MAG: SURF1 family protein [Burkholderiales bacterium]